MNVQHSHWNTLAELRYAGLGRLSLQFDILSFLLSFLYLVVLVCWIILYWERSLIVETICCVENNNKNNNCRSHHAPTITEVFMWLKDQFCPLTTNIAYITNIIGNAPNYCAVLHVPGQMWLASAEKLEPGSIPVYSGTSVRFIIETRALPAARWQWANHLLIHRECHWPPMHTTAFGLF